MVIVLFLGFFNIVEKEVLSNISYFFDKEFCMMLYGFSRVLVGIYKVFIIFEREVLERNIFENNFGIIFELVLVFFKCNCEVILMFDIIEKVFKIID